jgi:membrane protein implicated in regulation of membrane protease activity
MLLIVMVAALVVGIVSTLKLNMLIQSLIYAIVIGLVIYAIAKKS